MRIERKVIARKDQLLVAIPAALRDHLGLVASAPVFWHLTKKGAAMLTATGRARAGRMLADADCAACAKYRDELGRLRQLLRGGHTGDFNAAFNQGVQQGVKIVPMWRHDLETLHGKMNDALRLLAALVVTRRARRTGAPRRDAPPSPSPSSPGVPVDGGAETSGAEPPGLPLSAE
jgi:hypothetical protein